MNSDSKYPKYLLLSGYITRRTGGYVFNKDAGKPVYEDLYHFNEDLKKWEDPTYTRAICVHSDQDLKYGTHMTEKDMAKFLLINGLF